MAVSLKRLCELCPDLELLAGAGGVPNTPVRWMHTVETEEVASFLRGQELVFITGSGIGSPDRLAPLVESIYDEFASAVVVNTGPYISRVPEDVMAFCDSHDFPLFQIPWSVHIPDIMYTFSREIIDHERWASQVATSLRGIIQYPDQAELHAHTLRQEGVAHGGPYRVAVFRLEGLLPGSARDDQMRAVRRMVENELAANEWKAIPLEISGRYALVFPQEGTGAGRARDARADRDILQHVPVQQRNHLLRLGRLRRAPDRPLEELQAGAGHLPATGLAQRRRSRRGL